VACKPSSVPIRCHHRSGDGHPSERPTRGLSEQLLSARTPPFALLFGLAPARACRVSPPVPRGPGIVTVALVLASRRTGVTREPALWSSDFPRTPPFDDRARGRPAASRKAHCTDSNACSGSARGSNFRTDARAQPPRDCAGRAVWRSPRGRRRLPASDRWSRRMALPSSSAAFGTRPGQELRCVSPMPRTAGRIGKTAPVMARCTTPQPPQGRDGPDWDAGRALT
jgi:hypothetical protein